MHINQLAPALHKSINAKFNPMWLKKAELHISPKKTG
jgi:hypothetical protein